MDTTTQPPGTATEQLQADHRRLDRLMEDSLDRARAGDRAAAARSFAAFREGLIRHIAIEEWLLFPLFESATGLRFQGGPTDVMKQEHVEIIRHIDLIAELLDDADPPNGTFERHAAALAALIEEHSMKEERLLYPMTDRMATPAELDRLRNSLRVIA